MIFIKYQFALVFLVISMSFTALAKHIRFDCNANEILKENNIQKAQLKTSTSEVVLYTYADGSTALQMICENQLPKKLFVRRENSVILKDLVYNKLSDGSLQIDEYGLFKEQRRIEYIYIYERSQSSWVHTKTTRYKKDEESQEPVSDSFFNQQTGEINAQNFYNYEQFDLLKISYNRKNDSILGFKALDQNGKMAREYNVTQELEVSQTGSNQDLKILIMDSGFDLRHEAIFPYLKKPFFALNADSPKKLPFEELKTLGDHYPPFSHGTMTSSIALKDLTSAQLIPLSGDPRHYDMKRVTQLIKDSAVDFVNMSFYLPSDDSSGGPQKRGGDANTITKPSLRAQEINELIDLNPRTLWVIAAANGPMNLGIGVDMDVPSSKMYPASFESENILVVGAIETSEIIAEDLQNYDIAKFSNYGKETVDVLAPGRSIIGAALGGGFESWTGTSFSSPLALNLCAKVYEVNPALTPLQIKKLILLAVYVDLKAPFPVKSGGIIYPDRALYLAKLTQSLDAKILSQPDRFNANLKDLAIKAHEDIRASTHPKVENLKSQLLQFWKERDL